MNREDQAPARASSQVSKDTALLLYKSNFWSELSARQIAEFQMGQEPPSLDEIMELIPEEKRIVIEV